MDEKDINEVMPLFAPVYQPEFLRLDRMLSQAIANQQYNETTNQLAETILCDDQGNYNAWFLKKKFILSQVDNADMIKRESEFVDQCLAAKAKGFQVWEHKRFLVEHGAEGLKQLESTQKILMEKDHKNYHAWSFRVWLTDLSSNHFYELSFAQMMIKKDPFNNSAWNHLYFLLDHLAEKDSVHVQSLLKFNVDFCLKSIRKHSSNRASWNFLRGLFPSIKLRGFSSQNSLKKTLIASYDEFPQIEQVCKSAWNDNSHSEVKNEEKLSQKRQILATLVHIYSQKQETLEYARKICDQLKVKEPLRANYWSWVKLNL